MIRKNSGLCKGQQAQVRFYDEYLYYVRVRRNWLIAILSVGDTAQKWPPKFKVEYPCIVWMVW